MSCEKDAKRIWDDYSGEFNTKLVYQYRCDLRALDKDEQEIASLWRLVIDVNNGGFIQFFCNWGYDCYWCAMRGIQRMGLRDILQLFHNTYMDVLEKFREDKRLTYYSDIYEYLTDEDEKTLDETDHAFYDKYGAELCERAYRFYHDELKKTVEFDYIAMWDNFAGEYFQKLQEECGGNWENLSDKEREIAALWKLFDDMGGGGIELFLESGGICRVNAMKAIGKTGCREAEELFREAIDGLCGNKAPDEELMMKTDTTFWEGLDERLAEAAFKFYVY